MESVQLVRVFAILYAVVASQAALLCLVFYRKSAQNASMKTLARVLALFTVTFIAAHLDFSFAEGRASDWTWVSLFLPHVIGPAVFMHTQEIFQGKPQYCQFRFLAFFPPILLLILIVLIPDQSSVFTTTVFGSSLPLLAWLGLQMGLAQLLVYSALSVRIIWRNGIRVKSFYSSPEGMRPFWTSLLASMVFLAAFVHFLANFGLHTGESTPSLFDALGIFFPAIYVFGLSYFALVRPELMEALVKMNDELKDVDGPKYAKLRLDEDLERQMLERLVRFMDEEKPFQQPQLTLSELAEQVDIPSHLITMLLNLKLGKTYHEFVAIYRIEEVCRRLSHPKHANDTLLQIAFDSGFNSKTSFNASFKRIKGSTPGAYRAALSPCEP
ncbi:MAG: helix-turn-helix domain-containing protein [Spirochaetales bacterium]|nr:helix-turn-helix domain-containing protein [Spirochaetales bacterium]